MTKDEKFAIVEDLSEKLAQTNYFYITNAGGLTVAEVNKLRKICFEKGIEYKVFKNSLIQKALEKAGKGSDAFTDKVLRGFSGIMFSPTSSNIPAKIIQEYARAAGKNNKLFLKGASIDSEAFIGEDQLDTLVALKSKNELIGDIISLLQSPAKNVLSGLQSGGGKLAGILKTLSEKEG